jgi:hypothetical protein
MGMLAPERVIIETMFRIPNKSGEDVDFILNQEQVDFIENRLGRDIIAKARQLGFSTLILAIFLARCMMFRNRKCVIVSHDTTATQKLLERIKYMIKHMKGARPDLKYSTQSFITFGKMDSSIYIGTAGSADFGVGDTITDLHCSEVSRWENPGPLLSGLFQAVPADGNITIESTGRGTGNWFHRHCMRSKDGGNGYRLHFFGWLGRAEYHIFNSDEFIPDEAYEEPGLIEDYGVSVSQLKWRRMKISELDGDLQQFKEQYPITLNECFQATGNSFFSKVNFQIDPRWKKYDRWQFRLEGHPRIGRTYASGADIAGGNGQDYSVLEVFDVETGEQVLEFATNLMEPDLFALKVSEILEDYNFAFHDFERNNHGILYASELIKHYPLNNIHRAVVSRGKARTRANREELRKLSDYGTYTSDVSKNLMLGRMKKELREGTVVIYSNNLNMECSSFVENESGRLAAEEGCHDDLVMATGFALKAFEKAANRAEQDRDFRERSRGRTTSEVFSLDSALEELEHAYGAEDGCPISTGVDDEDTYD